MELKRHGGSNFDRLSDDLVVEILQRLYLKRVNRCKCVSKRWLSLISSRSFINSFTKRKEEALSLPMFGLFYQNCQSYDGTINTITVACSNTCALSNKNPLLGFSLEFLSVPIRVLSSSNGLVLCSDALIFQKIYYVCNPLTKHWVSIPPPPSAGLLEWARVGFLSSISSSSFVIVRVANYGEVSPFVILKKTEIYSSETGLWDECDLGDDWKHYERLMFCLHCQLSFKCSGLNAVACKGLLHWIGCGCVFVYDNNNNKYSVLQLPDERYNQVHDRYLGECNGNLMYIYFELNLTFNVWELIDYDENNKGSGKWGLLFKICLDQMVFHQPAVRNSFQGEQILMSFLAFHPFDKEVVFLRRQHRVLKCDMRKKTIRFVSRVAPLAYAVNCSMPYLVVLPWWPLHVSLPA